MDFSLIPFNLKELITINSNIWYPVEDDKKYMSLSAYNEALKESQEKKSKLLFNNIVVEYDSCDCGGGYPCNHSDFPIIIHVDKNHEIEIDGDSLVFYNHEKNKEIIINNLENFTYADFIRFCQLCDINLESNYVL